jgi:VIT1/CCC1 family predicted Fe2+/Mn2+ transporter
MTREKIVTSPIKVKDTIKAIFIRYNLSTLIVNNLLACLSKSPELLNFLMRFEHILPEPASSRSFTCALTIALGYFVAGFVPLLPYILVGQHEVNLGLHWSIGTMAVALLVFGYVKSCYVTGWSGWLNVFIGVRSGVEMVIVGGVAAGAAMGLVFIFDRLQSPQIDS